MRSFQARRKKPTLLYSWPVVTSFFLLTILLGRSALNSYFDFLGARRANTEITREAEEILAQKEKLEERLNYLSTPYGLEKELKREFGLVAPGENLAVIVERPAKETGDNSAEDGSFFSELIGFFKGFLIVD